MRILRDILVLSIAAFFAVMWGLMLRKKVVMAPPQPVRPNYDRLLGPEEEFRTVTFGIYRGASRLGRTRSTIRRQNGTLQLQSDTRFELGHLMKFMAPEAQTLEISFSAHIAPLHGLRYMRVNCTQLDLDLRGFVREEQLQVRGRVGGQKVSHSVPYTKQPFVGETLSPMSGLPNLNRASPDDVWTMHVVNPLLGGVQEIRVTLLRTREVGVGEETIRVHELDFQGAGRSWQACVTGDQEVLVQGTPFGLTLRRESIPPELWAFVRRKCLAEDETGRR
jgi:hypothetical protein